ncbi:hypothetical protein N7466_009320 [Penicillium verhagenii]|uniref:uncharacterized protein n=1 Tax=Penicillium verhagenii TaxID=1562060 RepID=UPI002544EFF4|nr:uncharacterized protein N7466_009320 [Penicillium verhagenii]KAJ5920994.1 hypothetical protein N7466_009320 [Penicillium verhagenii]
MHRQKLFDWYEFNVDFFGGRPVTCDTIITNCPPSDYLFGTPYRFTSLDNARAHHGYWAALSILQGLIAQAQSHAYCLSPAQVATNEDYLLSEFYADEISRSLPYCLADDKKAWGPHTSIFGLGQSCKVYTEFRRREKFLFTQEAMKHLGIMGSDFSKRMGEMMLYGWSLVEGVDQSPVVSSSPVEEISPVAEQVVIARVPGPSDCISQETM